MHTYAEKILRTYKTVTFPCAVVACCLLIMLRCTADSDSMSIADAIKDDGRNFQVQTPFGAAVKHITDCQLPKLLSYTINVVSPGHRPPNISITSETIAETYHIAKTIVLTKWLHCDRRGKTRILTKTLSFTFQDNEHTESSKDINNVNPSTPSNLEITAKHLEDLRGLKHGVYNGISLNVKPKKKQQEITEFSDHRQYHDLDGDLEFGRCMAANGHPLPFTVPDHHARALPNTKLPVLFWGWDVHTVKIVLYIIIGICFCCLGAIIYILRTYSDLFF